MVNLVKKRFKFLHNNKIVFIAFIALVFILYRQLFQSYFEADEWFHFTYYLPLTKKEDGFLTALLSTIISSGSLSAGQHVIPIASAVYFLNTKFFGLNYTPYAFMSLLLHATNSFLVFILIRTLLINSKFFSNLGFRASDLMALLGGIFFALAPTPMHAVTGAAPFYGQNVLSVTFFLLCILFFKLAFTPLNNAKGNLTGFIKRKKKFIYLSSLFLFLALFTKETAVFLFILLPFMALTEKRVFPLKFLGRVFVLCIIVYAVFRFVIPNFFSSAPAVPTNTVDTGTIVSRDLSIHKNLPGEILNRTLTFPLRMTGTLFLPRQTVFSIVSFITPIVVPLPDSQARLSFLYGAGNFVVIYLVALGILSFCIKLISEFIRKSSWEDARALTTGLAIIILGSLPLVAIIFSFPRWGYDFYFDSRFYYNPNVGAAIVFPFLLFGIAGFISKSLRLRKVSLIVIIIFIIWLVNNMYVFSMGIKQFTQNFQPDRREVVSQLKSYLPVLPQKAVFYIETDGLSAYGPILPFQTSVLQAITVVYYDKNPLPDNFFEKPLFDGKSEEYLYSEDRGFGYYTSKEELIKDLTAGRFEASDVYAFYYKSLEVKLIDRTSQVRQELKNYLKKTKQQ